VIYLFIQSKVITSWK